MSFILRTRKKDILRESYFLRMSLVPNQALYRDAILVLADGIRPGGEPSLQAEVLQPRQKKVGLRLLTELPREDQGS